MLACTAAANVKMTNWKNSMTCLERTQTTVYSTCHNSATPDMDHNCIGTEANQSEESSEGYSSASPCSS